MLLDHLPPALEDVEALLKRRGMAKTRKDKWTSTYQDAYTYAMPSRELFSWHPEGTDRQRQLYDSTLQEATYTGANTLHALLFPSWSRWSELAPGGAISKESPDYAAIVAGLQQSTDAFFSYLNHSNFDTVIGEVCLDLQVGTGGLSFDEGDNENPFVFQSLPISAIECEEGPTGKIETVWMIRKPKARDIVRMYTGLTVFDLPPATQEVVVMQPDKEVELVQGEIYHHETRCYYGVVIDVGAKQIVWRYQFGESKPSIIARAMKVAGETYGRGRVLLALPDAKTLDRMQEFVLKHAALQVAPPMTGVSDGVLNPYTATLTPNTIIPVASNEQGNPSLRPLELGGNFNITDALMNGLRERVRRTMLGPEPSEGAIKSATEISVADRNRLWAMNGEYSRIQSELAAQIVARGVFILQKKGLMPKFKVDGRTIAVVYTSPFAKSQGEEDVMSLQGALAIAGAMGPEHLEMGIKTEDIPAWVFRKKGLDETLIRTADERDVMQKKLAQAAAAMQAQPGTEGGAGGQPGLAGAGPGGPAV